jgi:hypothetical protein
VSTPKECGLLGRCFYAECHCKPAPVSATEPDAVRTLREGMRGQHALFNVNQEYVCAVAPLLEHIDALTARLAEAERVTEAFTDEQLDAGIRAVEALRTMRKVWEPEEKRDAFLTAARGGG